MWYCKFKIEYVNVVITPDKMEITSIPGIDRSISDENLKNYHMISKQYRNRRIGSYLKELEMIEGRNIGIPTILKTLEYNKSPLPIVETDTDRTYTTVVFPVQKEFFVEENIMDSMRIERDPTKRRSVEEIKSLILQILDEGDISRPNLLLLLGYSSYPNSVRNGIKELINEGKIGYTKPDQRHSIEQKLRKI